MGNEPPEKIYASVCAGVCRFLLEVTKGGTAGGGSRMWFNHDLILQLNLMHGEEDVRQMRINIKNMFPYVCLVCDKPVKLAILFEARQVVAFSY